MTLEEGDRVRVDEGTVSEVVIRELPIDASLEGLWRRLEVSHELLEKRPEAVTATFGLVLLELRGWSERELLVEA